MTAAWCLYALGCNVSVQDKLRAEIQSVFPSSLEDKSVIEQLDDLPYLSAVLKETFR